MADSPEKLCAKQSHKTAILGAARLVESHNNSLERIFPLSAQTK